MIALQVDLRRAICPADRLQYWSARPPHLTPNFHMNAEMSRRCLSAAGARCGVFVGRGREQERGREVFNFLYQAGEQRPGVLEDTLINRLWSAPRGPWQCEGGSIRASQWRCGMNGLHTYSQKHFTLHKMWKTSVMPAQDWVYMLSALIEYMNATCRSRPLLLEGHECLWQNKERC